MAEIGSAAVSANPEKSAIASNDIDWQYLTFDTLLPTPNPTSIKPNAAPPPPSPDLSKLDNPVGWSQAHKWTAVLVSSFGCMMVAYSSASYASAIADIEEEFGVSFNIANLGITFFNIGFGVIPMLCAPLSESIGRYPIFTISGIIFVVAQICCGVTRNFGGMVFSRFLAGCGGSTFSTIVGGVVSDVFMADGRNTPMAVFSSTTLAGVGFALAASGAIVQDLDWRWVFYVQAIIGAAAVGLVALFLRETRGNVVLRRRANTINKWYEQLEEQGYMGVEAASDDASNTSSEKGTYRIIRWKVEADQKRPSMITLIWVSLVRPFTMLFTEPVVFFFSLWATFTWSVLYITFESVPLVFTATHNFNDRENGLVFISMLVATLFIALPLCIIFDKRGRSSAKASTPESRMFAVCFMSACLPIGLFWFGWTQFSGIPWIVPVLAIGCLSLGIFFVYLAVFNYFADVYGSYASSAMAASAFCRNMVSGVFPYFSNIMFQRLTFQGASSLLGGLAILLMIAPVSLLMNGPKIRAMSKYVVK